MPASASCSPIHAELLSTMMPSSSSVPMATTSQRMLVPLVLMPVAAPSNTVVSLSNHGLEDAARPSTGSGLRTERLYLIGENGAASTILFSCLSAGLPPGGGQMPLSTAFLRTAARSSRLL